MRLLKGYRIVNNMGRSGVITELDYKNGQRVVSFENKETGVGWWCYKEQITEMYKPDGTKVY